MEEIMGLFDRFGGVRDYYQFSIIGRKREHQKLIKSYKEKIINALWPDGEFKGGLDLDQVDKLLSKFSRITNNVAYQIDIELYAVEQANKCADQFGGDFGEDYYEYLEEQFEKTLQKSVKHKLFEHQKEKIQAIVNSAIEGYGHRDMLEELLEKYGG